MVDFWTVVGRAVGNSKFRTALFEALKPQAYPTDAARKAIVFTEAQYQAAATAVATASEAAGFAPMPLSLMALGELLYATSKAGATKELETAAQVAEKELGGHTSANPLFYTALGAVLVDEDARSKVVGGGVSTLGFAALSKADKAKLRDVGASAEFHARAKAYCFDLWSPDCFVKMAFYSGHQHPATRQSLES